VPLAPRGETNVRPAVQIARALRGDAERLWALADDLRATNLSPAMVAVRGAARLLARAAREVEAADAQRGRDG
jgi:hypothetical protein